MKGLFQVCQSIEDEGEVPEEWGKNIHCKVYFTLSFSLTVHLT